MLFIDPVCPSPYSAKTLATGFLGGTEATVVRVLSGLPDASVMQHNRTHAEPGEPQYQPFSWNALPKDGPVVVLRSPHMALDVRRTGWRGPLYLWLHDIINIDICLALPHLRNAGIEIITVSNWHRDQICGVAQIVAGRFAPLPVFHVIYNPIDPSIRPSGIDPDPDRLVWLSMPNKGMADVLAHFIALRDRHPRLELHIAHPGHASLDISGVKVLGLMSHARAMEVMAGAFCMFCPNATQPETFGIVYAEANALGTPAMAHDFGAAAEILGDPGQLVNAYDQAGLIERFESWREHGRPVVKARDTFQLPNVLQSWRSLPA